MFHFIQKELTLSLPHNKQAEKYPGSIERAEVHYHMKNNNDASQSEDVLRPLLSSPLLPLLSSCSVTEPIVIIRKQG